MFESICTNILSPKKFKYSLFDLGSQLSRHGKRTDFVVYNRKKFKMNCSYYEPFEIKHQRICLVYLHSMNGSRLQSTVYVDSILQLGISFCCFDFSGCGNSEGQKISFGANQKYDVQVVINKLKTNFYLNKFIFWGRSMGSVCAIKYAQMMYEKSKHYPSVNKDQILGLILDSAFKSFSKLLVEIGSNQSDIPRFLVKAGFYMIRNSLEQNGQFGLEQLDLLRESEEDLGKKLYQYKSPIKKLKGNNMPILFLASRQDTTVTYQHSIDLYNHYDSNRKEISFFKGLHNESRDKIYLEKVLQFIKKVLLETKNTLKQENNLNESISKKIMRDFQQQKPINQTLRNIGSSVSLGRQVEHPHYRKLSQSSIFQTTTKRKPNSFIRQNIQISNKSNLMKKIENNQNKLLKNDNNNIEKFEQNIKEKQGFLLQSCQTSCNCNMFGQGNSVVFRSKTDKKTIFKFETSPNHQNTSRKYQYFTQKKKDFVGPTATIKKKITELNSLSLCQDQLQQSKICSENEINLRRSIPQPMIISHYIKPVSGQLPFSLKQIEQQPKKLNFELKKTDKTIKKC